MVTLEHAPLLDSPPRSHVASSVYTAALLSEVLVVIHLQLFSNTKGHGVVRATGHAIAADSARFYGPVSQR